MVQRPRSVFDDDITRYLIIVNFAENRGDVKISIQIRLCFPRSKIIPRCTIFTIWPFPGKEWREEKREREEIFEYRIDTIKRNLLSMKLYIFRSWVFLSNCSDAEHMELGCCWYLRRIKTANSFLGKQRSWVVFSLRFSLLNQRIGLQRYWTLIAPPLSIVSSRVEHGESFREFSFLGENS